MSMNYHSGRSLVNSYWITNIPNNSLINVLLCLMQYELCAAHKSVVSFSNSRGKHILLSCDRLSRAGLNASRTRSPPLCSLLSNYPQVIDGGIDGRCPRNAHKTQPHDFVQALCRYKPAKTLHLWTLCSSGAVDVAEGMSKSKPQAFKVVVFAIYKYTDICTCAPQCSLFDELTQFLYGMGEDAVLKWG